MLAAVAGCDGSDRVHVSGRVLRKDGTLIIDELTDLDALAQKLILSTLEQGKFSRVGGHNPQELKARVLATVKDGFETAIEHGQLRRQLVANLNVLSVRIPPLREYAEDCLTSPVGYLEGIYVVPELRGHGVHQGAIVGDQQDRAGELAHPVAGFVWIEFALWKKVSPEG